VTVEADSQSSRLGIGSFFGAEGCGMTQNYVFSNGAAGEDPCLSLGKALKKAASPGPGTTMGDMLKSIVAFPITFLLTTVTYPPE